tara:strand:- start:2042 stop:2500 length:459 start_codon:yes stop_codon:yes gene_type:complete
MSKFATGKYSYAISDRSGLRYRYKDMRREWNGLLVGKDEYETKHPQLGPFRTPTDAQALKDARPFNDSISVNINFPTFNLTTVEYISIPKMHALVGSVSISGAIPVQPITVSLTGVSATISLGSLSVSATVVSTFDSTGVTLDSTSKTFDEG